MLDSLKFNGTLRSPSIKIILSFSVFEYVQESTRKSTFLPPMKNSNLLKSIRRNASSLQNVQDDRLRELSLKLKYDAMIGTKITRLIPEGFALVIEAARRHIGLVHLSLIHI